MVWYLGGAIFHKHCFHKASSSGNDEEPTKGEDEELVWTQRGVNSLLGEPAWAVANKPVNDGFLRVQPLSVRQGLQLKYWKIQKKEDVRVVQNHRYLFNTPCLERPQS